MKMADENKIDEVNQFRDKLTEYVNELIQRSDVEYLNKLADMRDYDIDTLKKCNVFYIGDMAEMIIPKYLNYLDDFGIISAVNGKPIYNKRWIIPIYSNKYKIKGLVGYSNTASERYVYSNTKYFMRNDAMWGAENLEMAYDLGYAIITEGITDAIRLRDMGYSVCFSMNGAHDSEIIKKQLNRCRNGVIVFHDRDNAGFRIVDKWNFNRRCVLTPAIKYKDVDAMCRGSENNKAITKLYVDKAIQWIKLKCHRDMKCSEEKAVIYL